MSEQSDFIWSSVTLFGRFFINNVLRSLSDRASWAILASLSDKSEEVINFMNNIKHIGANLRSYNALAKLVAFEFN